MVLSRRQNSRRQASRRPIHFRALWLGSVALSVLVLVGWPNRPAMAEPAVSQSAVSQDAVPRNVADRRPDAVLLEEVRVEPDTDEARYIVGRNLTVVVGTRVEAFQLAAVREELSALPSVDQVEVYTTRGSGPGAVILVVEVDFGKRFRVETGVGREDLQGWYLNMLGAHWNSPFRRGGAARLGLHSGLRHSGIYGELEIPSLVAGSDLVVDLAGYDRDWIVRGDGEKYSLDLHQTQFLVGLRRHFIGGQSLGGELELKVGSLTVHPGSTLDSDSNENPPPVSDFVPIPTGEEVYLETRLDWSRNRWNPQHPWQEGHWSGLQLRFADKQDGPAFWSATGDFRLARPFLCDEALAFRVLGSWTASGTPYHQRFMVGGVRSVRGYSSAELSGSLGAQASWSASAEWRSSLVGADPGRPRVLGTLFLDVGDHWDSSRKRAGVAAGVGHSVTFRIPWVQLINFEVAYPLMRDRADADVSVYMTLGQSF